MNELLGLVVVVGIALVLAFVVTLIVCWSFMIPFQLQYTVGTLAILGSIRYWTKVN